MVSLDVALNTSSKIALACGSAGGGSAQCQVGMTSIVLADCHHAIVAGAVVVAALELHEGKCPYSVNCEEGGAWQR